MQNKALRLNVHYSVINGLFLALVCGTMGFAANFLLSKDMTNATVGLALTIVSVVGAVFQAVFAPVIDKSEKLSEKGFILASLVVEIVGAALLLVVGNGLLLIPVVVVTFAASTVGMPFLNSVAFLYEKEGISINYGVSRGIGSAAYAVAGWVFGQLLVVFSPAALPWFYLVLGALTFLAVLTLPNPTPLDEREKAQQAEAGAQSLSYPQFFKKYFVLTVVFFGMVALYFCHMLIGNFMINVVSAIVGEEGAAGYQGTAVFIQAMVELPTMFLFAQIMKRFSIKSIIAFAAIMYTVKHVVVLLSVMTTSIPLYYVGMALQMLSFAVLTPGLVYFANDVCEKADLNKGQSVMALSSTIGGLFANLIGGALFDAMPVTGVVLVGVIASAVGTVLVVLATMGAPRRARQA